MSSQRRDAALDIERWICAFMDEHIVPFRRDQGHSNAVLDKLLAAIGKLGSGWLQAALALPFD